MKFLVLPLLAVTMAQAEAVKLSDYRPYSYEVLFTNPTCETYDFKRELFSNAGNPITSKPDDVYCKASDEAASVARKSSPQYRLREWITDASTKELDLAYLSFKSKAITTALCEAVKRGVKLRLVLDSGDGEKNASAESLKECGKEGQVEVHYRGETGGLGFAHNKIMIVNPRSSAVKIVFSSGNMTTGTSINHENWNFITTSGSSYFAQVHSCVLDGMIVAGESKQSFKDFMGNCRSKISAKPESDITAFFVPVDGKEALAKVREAGMNSTLVEGMSHRFSGDLVKLFAQFLASGKNVRFLLDDDVYWTAKLKKDIGRNQRTESFGIYNQLISKGMDTRFLQTNEQIFQLQHNKLIVFSTDEAPKAVFAGAGNFTSSAFTNNFENFYFITIPEVVKAFKEQYKKYFFEMATKEADMPRDYVHP